MFVRLLHAAVLTLAAGPALAQLHISPNLKSGEQVYRQTCVACHESGVAHAPKFKDAQAWAPLIQEGQAVLTGHAWVGVRAMPAQGGDPKLSLVEFARAVAYMANQAGGDWKDPDVPMMRRIIGEAEKRIDHSIAESRKMKQHLQQLSRGKATR
jgi:cytochrome c5